MEETLRCEWGDVELEMLDGYWYEFRWTRVQISREVEWFFHNEQNGAIDVDEYCD